MLDHLHVEYLAADIDRERSQSDLPIECDQCHTTIEAGGAFTRRFVPTTGSIHTICQECAPFRLVTLPIARDRVHTQPMFH